jgi:hypothetical protein
MPAQAAPRGTEKNNDPEDGENAAVFEEAARGWLGRADAVAFAQLLFYQPLMANVALQETDPVGSSRATGRDPGVRADGDCTNPFGDWLLNHFWNWRSVMRALGNSAILRHFVPTHAAIRGGRSPAQGRPSLSPTPPPTATVPTRSET